VKGNANKAGGLQRCFRTEGN